MHRPVVLFTEGSDPRPLAWLAERAEVLQVDLNDVALDEALNRAEGLVVRSYTRVDDALLTRSPKLRVVGRGGVGLDMIDVPACRARGVEVVYTPDANTRAVVEFVMGLAVKLVRPWHMNSPELFGNGFKRLRQDAGEHLSDLTLGVLGFGRVGSSVARVANVGFGMRVLYHDLLDLDPPAGVAAEAVSFDRLVRESDLLTVHVDGRASNRHLIDDAVLRNGRFRWLINTSRGTVVNAEAVADALDRRGLAGVALDVFDPEPPPAGSAYARLLNDHAHHVILTPHMASRTTPAVENMSWVVRDVLAVLEGRAPAHPAPID